MFHALYLVSFLVSFFVSLFILMRFAISSLREEKMNMKTLGFVYSIQKKHVFMAQSTGYLFYVFTFLACLSGVMVIKAKNPIYSVLFLILVFTNASGLLLIIDLDFFSMIFLTVYVGAIAVLFLFVIMMLNLKLAEINDNILHYLPISGLFGALFLAEILLLYTTDVLPVMIVLPYTSYDLDQAAMLGFFGSCNMILLLLSSVVCFIIINTHESFSSFWSIQGILTELDFSRNYFENREDQMNLQVAESYSKCVDVHYVVWPHTLQHTNTIETLGNVLYTYYLLFFIMAGVILLISMIGAIVLTMHKGVFVKKQEIVEQNTRDFSKTIHKIRVFNKRKLL